MTDTRKEALETLLDLESKLLCGDCGATFGPSQYQIAPHPFIQDEHVYGCPACGWLEATQVCDASNCDRPVTSGTPNFDGYRYIRACRDHSPLAGNWTTHDPDRALISQEGDA